MSEELEKIVEEELVEEEETPEYTETELKAIEKGWNPEGVEGKRNLSAEEFLDREEFYTQIHSLKRENKKLSEDVKNLATYQNRVREDERKKVIEELKAAKKLAYANEDYDKIVEIDEQLAEARTVPVEEQTNDIQVEAKEAFNEFVARNKWYETDADMREYAEIIGRGLFNPQVRPEEFYEKVEKAVKTHFKDKFEPATGKKTTPVEPATRGRGRTPTTKITEKHLSEGERSIMHTVLRNTPGMTKEQYLADYEAQMDR